MVRHGEAAAGYNEHPDPGLSGLGRNQARAVAELLGPLGPLPIVSSPMARARETAAPLAELWQQPVAIEPAVSEIPSPSLTPAQRGPWLQKISAGTWADTTDEIRRWRDGILAALLALDGDHMVFSHYVAINAAISVATGSDQTHCRRLAHCAVTEFDSTGGSLRLTTSGDEGDTVVL